MIRKIATLIALAAAPATPAVAQMIDHSRHQHQGHAPSAPLAATPSNAAETSQADPHAGHAGHANHGAAPAPQAGPPAMNAPPPPTTWAGDALYPPGALAAARARMLAEHGGMTMGQVMVNIAELGAGSGSGSYRWDGEGWWGGDLHRVVIKSEGEGRFGDPLETGEVQALYARAIDPYWTLQAGVRQDLGRGPSRRYATIGVEGLAPYWFEVEAAIFLSDRGDVQGRIEAWYDQRITQRLVLQPRAELNAAAQGRTRDRIGAGLSHVELGLRLRYEMRREFAPYLGVSWDRRVGDTARLARRSGEDVEDRRVTIGLRFWL